MTTIPVVYDHKFISLFKIAQNVTIPYVQAAPHATFVTCVNARCWLGNALHLVRAMSAERRG